MTSAWRKRLKRGENAKGIAGAISRHRPHFFDGIKQAKRGNRLHGGNNKKQSQLSRHNKTAIVETDMENPLLIRSMDKSLLDSSTDVLSHRLLKLWQSVTIAFLFVALAWRGWKILS